MMGAIFAMLLLALLAALIVPWLLPNPNVARCLDLGGSFNFEKGRCEIPQHK